ncbi:MAG TPA: hypothetical protein VF691_03985, partial [Cytophagaceae bacterium]
EVLTFFSSNRNLLDYFGTFMDSYSKLILGTRDKDTAFFINPRTNKNEIYFHFIPNNIEYEFSWNYTELEQKHIKLFFHGQELFTFDIQFGNEELLKELLMDFKDYLMKNGNVNIDSEILINHPQKGILKLNEDKLHT